MWIVIVAIYIFMLPPIRSTVGEWVAPWSPDLSQLLINPHKTITEDDVYIVWSCKTLQNFKALASTTVSDGMYYEITHNGDKNETYFDVYKKWENFVVRGGKYEDNN